MLSTSDRELVITGFFGDLSMKLQVSFLPHSSGRCSVFDLDTALHSVVGFYKLMDVGEGQVRCREFSAFCFQNGEQLVEIFSLLVGYFRNRRAPAMVQDHKTIRPEELQRVTNIPATRTKSFAQIVFDETLARVELSLNDLIAKHLVDIPSA